MSGIHDEFNGVIALCEEHLQTKFDFPIRVVEEIPFTEESKEVDQAHNVISNNKYERGATAFRYLKKGAKKDTSTFDKKVHKLMELQKEVNALKINAGHLVQTVFSDNLDRFRGILNDVILDNAHFYLNTPVTIYGKLGASSHKVSNDNYYAKRLKDVQKSATKSCIHCKKRFKTSELTMLHAVVCRHCNKRYPFDTATEEKKRAALNKVIEKKADALEQKIKDLLKVCPYLYTVLHSYPDNETDESTYNGLYR